MDEKTESVLKEMEEDFGALTNDDGNEAGLFHGERPGHCCPIINRRCQNRNNPKMLRICKRKDRQIRCMKQTKHGDLLCFL
jgi:hypothetical protein